MTTFLLLITAALSAAPIAPVQTDTRANWPTWVVPDLASAATAGTPIDLSFLNPEPAGTHGRLRARGEDLVDARGRVVRLFGTNLTDYHAMPPKDVSPRIAERLRQLGFNFVRLHYFDWAAAPNGMMEADMEQVNDASLDRLHFLVAELKRCGIYTDLNLHVARAYPGLPKEWDRMGKGVDLWHAPYMKSQRAFASTLLGRNNPYTGIRLADDPAVVAVELNNENSILDRWPQYATLPTEFTAPLQTTWNAWLAQRYPTRAALAQAWNPPAASVDATELLRNGNFAAGTADWTSEVNGGASASLAPLPPAAGPGLRWQVDRAGAEAWHVQLHQSSVPLREGTVYELRFSARSTPAGRLNVRLMQQAAPWATVGLGQTIVVGPEWQAVTMYLLVKGAGPVPVRLNLDTDRGAGTYELRDLSLRAGGPMGLGPNESPAEGTVPLPRDSGVERRTADYLTFLLEQESAYGADLAAYLRDSLRYEGLIWQTQVNYGGLGGLRRAEREGVTDIHGYPAHPALRSTPQGDVWAVRNVSMLGEAYGGLEWLAFNRVPGQPFFVTEFDLNPPNDHSAETFPLLAAMACLQGWAGFNDYAWFNFQVTYGWDHIVSPFATTGHAGQMSTVPMAALMFRQGRIPRLPDRREVQVPREGLADRMGGNPWYGAGNVWTEAGGTPDLAWEVGLGTRTVPGEPTKLALPARPAGARPRSLGGRIQIDRQVPDRARLVVAMPTLRMAIGHIAGESLALGDAQLLVESGPRRDYANFSVISLDGKPLAQSTRLLVTTLGRVENRDWVWDADRTYVQEDWGKGPTVAEPIAFRLTLPNAGWRARTLKGNGQPDRVIPMFGRTLTVSASAYRPWIYLDRAAAPTAPPRSKAPGAPKMP